MKQTIQKRRKQRNTLVNTSRVALLAHEDAMHSACSQHSTCLPLASPLGSRWHTWPASVRNKQQDFHELKTAGGPEAAQRTAQFRHRHRHCLCLLQGQAALGPGRTARPWAAPSESEHWLLGLLPLDLVLTDVPVTLSLFQTVFSLRARKQHCFLSPQTRLAPRPEGSTLLGGSAAGRESGVHLLGRTGGGTRDLSTAPARSVVGPA